MAAGGMDLAKASERIVDQLAAGAFWVSTQPRMTRTFLDARISFLRDQSRPRLADDLMPIFADMPVAT
jgi:hypothetical protein